MQLSVLSQPALSFAPRYPCALFLQPPSVLQGPDGVRLSKELSQPQPPISLPQGSQWPGEGGGGGGNAGAPLLCSFHGCRSWAAHIWTAARRRGGCLACSPTPPPAPPGRGFARPFAELGALGSSSPPQPRGVAAVSPYLAAWRWRPGRVGSFLPSPPPGAGDWNGRSLGDRLAPGITCGGAGQGRAGLGTAERSGGGHGSGAAPSQPRTPSAAAEGTASAPRFRP